MVSETLWVYIKVTVSLAIWTVSRVFKQLKIIIMGMVLDFIWLHIMVIIFMAI